MRKQHCLAIPVLFFAMILPAQEQSTDADDIENIPTIELDITPIKNQIEPIPNSALNELREDPVANKLEQAASDRIPGQHPRPGIGDPRIRTIIYQSNQVFEITTNFYVSTTIHFAKDEALLPRPIIGGDPLAWDIQVIAPNAIAVKPIAENPGTNMTIHTDKRVYYFLLDVADKQTITNAVYGVHFRYPLEEQARARLNQGRHGYSATPPDSGARAVIARQNELLRNSVALANIYTGYRIKGSRNAKPETIFDDGRFTYFRFPPGMIIPAIYAKDPDGEKLVNHHNQHNYVIVQRLAQRFTLRAGRSKTNVIRNKPPRHTASYEPSPARPVRQQQPRQHYQRQTAIRPNIGMTHDAHAHTDMLLQTPAIQNLPATPFEELVPVYNNPQTIPRSGPIDTVFPGYESQPTTPNTLATDAFIKFRGAAPDIPCENGEWRSRPDPQNPSQQQYVLHCPE